MKRLVAVAVAVLFSSVLAGSAMAQVGIGVGVGTGGNASTGHATGVGNSAVVGSGNNSGSNLGNSSSHSGVIGSGNSSSTSGVKSSIHNDNRDVNVNSNKQGQKQGQQQGQAQGQKQGIKDSANVSIEEGDYSYEEVRQAPAVFAPNLTASPEACMGSISGGGSAAFNGVGFGLTFGSTWKNPDCERRAYALRIAAMGPQYNGVIVALFAQNADVEAAFVAAGIPIPGKTGVKAASLPASTIQGGVKQEKRDVPSVRDNRPEVAESTELQTALNALGMASAIQGL